MRARGMFTNNVGAIHTLAFDNMKYPKMRCGRRQHAEHYQFVYFRLHRMHEMQTIVTDMRGVCQSICLSVTRLNSASQCGGHSVQLCQITFASCIKFPLCIMCRPIYLQFCNCCFVALRGLTHHATRPPVARGRMVWKFSIEKITVTEF